jgi:leishmanolysin-like peptidase
MLSSLVMIVLSTVVPAVLLQSSATVIEESLSYPPPPVHRKRRRKTTNDNDDKWLSIINNNKRNTNIRTLQYGTSTMTNIGGAYQNNSGGGHHHPFEAFSHDRLLQATATTTNGDDADIVVGGTSVYFEDDRYSPTFAPTVLLPQPMSTSSSPSSAINNPNLYKPIRIIVDTSKLIPYIELDPTRYSYLVDYLNTTAGPAAALFWSTHLSTIPVTDTITITKDDCPLLWNNNDDTSTIYTFTNADLIIYLLIDDGPCLSKNPPKAFSSDCLSDQFDRPIVGTVLLCTLGNFDTFTFDNVQSTLHQRQRMDEVLQHEFAHILGMSGSKAPYWRNALQGGAPYTSRPLVKQNVTCLDGTIKSIYLPSTSTMMEGVTARGIKYYEIVTPTVRNIVANQFNCWTVPDADDDDRIIGARLDTNDGNCIGSHWSTRYFGTEIMVSRDMSWKQSVSALTLALMEDTGWYKANYDASSGVSFPSAYGYGRGCAFLTDDCILDGGAIPQNFGLDIFCNTTTLLSDVRCDASYQRIAKCDLVDYDMYTSDPIYPYLDNVPNMPGAQYQARFGESNLGSFLRFDAEYCPTYTAPPSFVTDVNGIKTGPMYMECSNSDTAPIDVYDFESFGVDGSTCINTIGAIARPLCLQIECVVYSGVVVVVVTIGVNGETITCEEDGQVIDIMTGLQIVCPQREVLCPGYYCPANCAGRGVCQHGQVDGCKCFNPEDTSPHCANSPIVPPTIMPTSIPDIHYTQTPLSDIQFTETPAVATTNDGAAYTTVYDEGQNSITIIIGSPTVTMTAACAAVSFTLQHALLIMIPLLLINSWM